MKKIIFSIMTIFLGYCSVAQEIDTLHYTIDDVSVVSFYRNNTNNIISRDDIVLANKGQEPSFLFSSLPNIFAYSDTGNEYGYSYFRMRGMDQSRINMTLDGMPLAEGEDLGVYFSNFPDILSSMNSIKIDNGSSISNNGTAGYAGSINFESINLAKDNNSYAYIGIGSFNTYKTNVQYNSGKIGKFAFHINATSQQSDGFRDYAYNSSQSTFVKVGYFINDNHSLDVLSFVGHSRNGQAWIGSTLDEININPNNNGCSDKETDKFVQNITKLQYKGIIGNTTISSSFYYNFLNGHYLFDVDNYCNKVYNYPHEVGEIDTYNLRHNMFGGNIVGKTYFNNSYITYGINASRFNRRHLGTWNLTDDILYNNTGYKTDLNTFISGNYSFDDFEVNGNIQYRYANFDYVGDVNFDKIHWNFLNWHANIKYHLNNNHNFYASVTRTHREPTRTDMFGGNENFDGNLVTTTPESVYDYEVGYSVDYKKFSGNINLYYMNFSNELILNGETGTNGLPLRVNSTESYRYGLEVILEYHPCKVLSLINKSSFAKNEVKDDTKRYNHAMSPSCTISQDVNFNISKSFNVNLNYSYRSNMYIDLMNIYDLGDSHKFNISANYKVNNIIISGKVNNIFNSRSFSNGMIGANSPLYFIDAPRNFFVDVKFVF